MLKLNLKAALSHSKYKILVLAVSIACASTVYFLLTRIDLIVHGQLYTYGLIFNAEWADPYRTLMWSIYGCLLAPAALSGAVLIVSLIKHEQELPPKSQQVQIPRKIAVKQVTKVEKASGATQGISKSSLPRAPNFEQRMQETPKVEIVPRGGRNEPEVNLEGEVEQESEPLFVARSESDSKGQVVDMIISCPKCKKTFHRPLVMLDFGGAKPRLVNVCPFCNQILGSSDPEMGVFSGADVEDELVKHGDY